MSVASTHHHFKSTILTLLNERISINSFNQIHALLLTSGITQDYFVLINFVKYLATLFHPSFAYKSLHQIHHLYPNAFPFNSLISEYAQSKKPRWAFAVYKHMFCDSIRPDKYTYPIVLKSCVKFLGFNEGRQLHGVSIKIGFACRLYVQNALVHLYGICGRYSDAGSMFDEMGARDVVSWTGLISAYVKGGMFSKALELFGLMDVEPNMATLVNVLVACGRLGNLVMGKGIHCMIFKREAEVAVIVCNSLLDMYAKCECLDDAKKVFEELHEKDVVSWTSMISGLVQCKKPNDAIEVFYAMQATGMEPDKVTLSSVLSACASLGALDSGRWVHEYIDRKGIEWDVHIGTSMVDMYGKCGCLDAAMLIFRKMPHKNVSSWNALLGGLAIHGYGKEALVYFGQMVHVGITPNEVTFIAILSACCHSGLVEEGRYLFDYMTKFYNLTPWIEHYGCMVDLLGRAGLLVEAYELIRVMPMAADMLIWGAMLSACKAHGNVDLSQQIIGHLLELKPIDSGVYVLLSNIYATNDRWGDVTALRKLMRKKGVKKEPGSSVIEVNGKTHEFLVGDCDHPQKEEIFLVLGVLAKQVPLDGL
ncbi:pentatricopeptide repeat-containing protein At4g38010 [Typha latifolia]|uniref:pentatricopeptide repeat-containing protein At4g38010 n=1 Tax=Typha latifolia TaxID=4733 RepID=UPI003C30ABE6